MSSFRSAALVLVVASLVAASPAAASVHYTTTRRAAERHLLNAPRFFLRWGGKAALVVDPRTRWVKSGVTAVCRSRTTRAHAFRCTVRDGSIRLRVRVVATGHKSVRYVRVSRR